MKKEFQKPLLKRCALRLNENIASSWEYYYDHGLISSSFAFTYTNPDTGEFITHKEGCFTYLTDNKAWDTGTYSGDNVALLMTYFLLDEMLVPAYNADANNPYIKACYSSTLPTH